MVGRRLESSLRVLCLALAALASPAASAAASAAAKPNVSIDWSQTLRESNTSQTVQVCPEPPMRRGHAIHRQTHDALRDLEMPYARLQPWFPFPRLAMAALEPPANGRTSWDFSLIDPIVLDFYAAAEGRPIMLNMAIPRWLFKTSPHRYPDDPDQIDWGYEFGENVGSEFRDPTLQEAAEYFRRIAQWYIRGGFVDEYGKEHKSGHRLKIDYWEVLNEQDEYLGHSIDPATYTKLYDEVVLRLQKIDPQMKFSALALHEASNLHYVEHFLDPRNHKPGVPLDMISYHKYITARRDQTPLQWQESMFAETDVFLGYVKRIEGIRQRLSPATKTFISEFGVMWDEEVVNTFASFNGTGTTSHADPAIPEQFWTLAASVHAYGILGAMRRGVDLIAAAELVDFPGQFAGTNLIHWRTGEPNAVYRVVKMLHEQFQPGDRLVLTQVTGAAVDAQAFATPRGRKLLLINKKAQPVTVSVSGMSGGQAEWVDMHSGSRPPSKGSISGNEIVLGPQAVMVLTAPLGAATGKHE